MGRETGLLLLLLLNRGLRQTRVKTGLNVLEVLISTVEVRLNFEGRLKYPEDANMTESFVFFGLFFLDFTPVV